MAAGIAAVGEWWQNRGAVTQGRCAGAAMARWVAGARRGASSSVPEELHGSYRLKPHPREGGDAAT